MTRRKVAPEMVLAVLGRDTARLRAAIVADLGINERDRDGRTALHHAAISGETDMANMLVEAGAMVNVGDADGWTPLHFAARDHQLGVAEVLLRAGAPIDQEDSHGNTPLFRAVFESRGRAEMITFLREHGADDSHKNRHGISPRNLAETIANYDVKKYFTD